VIDSFVVNDSFRQAVCLRRPEAEPALSAAAFLSESISGGPSATGRQPGEHNWALPQELRTHVDSAVGQLGQQLVEVSRKPHPEMKLTVL
jgi:hypothetical protein